MLYLFCVFEVTYIVNFSSSLGESKGFWGRLLAAGTPAFRDETLKLSFYRTILPRTSNFHVLPYTIHRSIFLKYLKPEMTFMDGNG